MGRITVNVPDPVEEWLEAESERLGWSKSKTGGECIKLIHSESNHITPHQTASEPDQDIQQRLRELERRVDELEDASSGPKPQTQQVEKRHPDQQTAVSREPDETIREVVDDSNVYPRAGVSQGQRQQRLNAGLAAVELLRESEHGVVRAEFEELWEDYPVDSQKPPSESDTYWRKSLRPALQAVQSADYAYQSEGSWEWYWTGFEE
ncbi:hypothetical protein [Haloferax marisrubri]|uniref:Uncharacterized protein n=1 Tax=Haloferax marisrubri TaxID=1544719 RepID=A0A2P4NVX8_9EURY|nr:hypothetical protein [Haloferax marisrubri]POG57248.1 hypothetical protein AUR65_001415 [Haloferax marisrubri]